MPEPTVKLGRLPAVRPPGIKDLSAYATLPPPPPTSLTLARIPWQNLGMDGNDQIGDCVLAGADHQLASWNALSSVQSPRPTEAEIRALYFQLTGGPDSGLVVSSVLNIWQTQGLWGTKIAAYAPIPLQNKTALMQGIVNYGTVGIGIRCPASAQEAAFDPKIWSVVPGSPIVGLHYIIASAYDANTFFCQSWGYTWAVTWDFINTYADEMWVAIAPEFAQAGKGPTLNLTQLQADLGQA